MSKNRYSARTDENEKDIVKTLRDIPGVSVAVNHDDILVGYNGFTFWFEIKRPDQVSKRTGMVWESVKKDSQKKLENEWTGHYKIVWRLEQILEDLGIKGE